MAVAGLIAGLHIIPGLVNVYLLETADGLAVVDTGFARDTAKILDGIAAIGRAPEDVRHILLTHAHPDHIGGAAALRKRTGARVYAHGLDAPIIEAGGPARPIHAAPGLRNMIVAALLSRLPGKTAPTKVDGLLHDGVAVPFDDDILTIHIPGHCAGQVAFLWKRAGGILFAADACINRKGMVLAAAQEDVGEARSSLTRLAGYAFEVACFGHGPPIMAGADREFRKRWL
ncbi:MBL fold metallo-hydrolase [Beijerinckia sp. L45]|uniref:MBL fold metallo-hydrolase n=1 Tax=Beijerinckia sp. L45 TaxID=1641855 RepID=UPI00131E2285|nr:MBL fold metallo-hydrolase [Beijerinckia sp. L45]